MRTRSLRSRTTRTALAVGAAALVLAGCGGDDPDTGTAATGAVELPSPSATATSTATDDGAAGGASAPPAGAAAALPARPQPDTCVEIPEAADGRYTVYDAGSAVVTRDGDRLTLQDVQAADGWTARVDDQSSDEVEIDFRRDGDDVLDLEVEIDDGRVKVEICADDD